MSAQVDELVDLSADPVLFAIQGVDKMRKALTSSSRAGFLEIISSSRARMRAYSSRGVLARGGKIGWLTCGSQLITSRSVSIRCVLASVVLISLFAHLHVSPYRVVHHNMAATNSQHD
jgi:hypothetical protein